jgi:hypothetical protein
VLNDTNYSWRVLGTNDAGQTSFWVDSSPWESGYFKVSVGDDLDGDGVPDWADAYPDDPAIGVLSLTIDSPASGSTLQ